jgi:hypothetical protein
VENRARIAAVSEQLAQERELSEQSGQQENAAIAILNTAGAPFSVLFTLWLSLIKGKKRHLLVDTLGLVLHALVTAANACRHQSHADR